MPVSYKKHLKYLVQNPPFDSLSKLFDILKNFLVFNPLNRRNANATGRPVHNQSLKLTAFAVSRVVKLPCLRAHTTCSLSDRIDF